MKVIVTVVAAIFILVSNAFPMMHEMNSTGIVYADEFKHENGMEVDETDVENSNSAEAEKEISTEEDSSVVEDSNSTEEIQEEESEVSDEKADPEILEKSDAPETTEDIAVEVSAGPASEINSETNSETDEETSAVTDDVDDTVISENENSETVESTEAESSVNGEMSTVAAPEDEISSVEAPTTSSENLLELPEDSAAEVDSTNESTETTKVEAPEDDISSVEAPEEVTAVGVAEADIQVSFDEVNLSDSDSDTVEKLYQEDITLHKTYEVLAGNESQILIEGLDPNQMLMSSDDFDISYVETDPFGGSYYKISPKNNLESKSGQVNLTIKGKDDAINYTFSVINGEDYDHPTFSKSQNVNFDSYEIYHVNYDMGDEDIISGPYQAVNYKDGLKYNLLYDRDIIEKKGSKFVGWSFDKEGHKMIPADWKYLNSIEFPVYDSSKKDITLYAIYESDAADEPVEPVDPVTPAPDPVDPVPVKPTPAPDPVDPVPVVPEPTPAPLPVPESPKQEEKQNPVEPDTHSSGRSGREILPVHAVFTSVPAVAEVPTEDLTALDESRPSSKPEVTTLVSVPPTVKNTHAPWITRSIKTGDNKNMIFHGIMLLLAIGSLSEWVKIWKIKTHR